jgi:hypothetical protein
MNRGSIWVIIGILWVIGAVAAAWKLLRPAHKAGLFARPECRLSRNPLAWVPFVLFLPVYWLLRLLILLFSPVFWLAALYGSWSWNRNAVRAEISDEELKITAAKSGQARTVPWSQVQSWRVEFFPPFNLHHIVFVDGSTECVGLVTNWDETVPETLARRGVQFRDETNLEERGSA